jgi:tRNA-specific 2-thiouridylase
LNQYQLSKALFPIGHLQKSEVREIARSIGLGNADKKDSQGLCFIGKVKLPVFLQQQLDPKEGNIVEIEDARPSTTIQSTNDDALDTLCRPAQLTPSMGNIIGRHQGAHYYTVGQRKGLGVGGKALPLFILETDTRENIVYVGQGEDHWALLRQGLKVESSDIHWVRADLALKSGEERNYLGRIRYRQELTECKLSMTENGLYVLFSEPQRGIAAGQFVAWYEDDELIGSGVIAG